MKCRFCKTDLKNVFIDLINSPASNSYLSYEQLNESEVFFPLKFMSVINVSLCKSTNTKNLTLFSIMNTRIFLLIQQVFSRIPKNMSR